MASDSVNVDQGKSLDNLLQKSQTATSLLPDELSYLISAFTPTQDTSLRSKAYLILSSFCQGVRTSPKGKAAPDDIDPATELLTKTFEPIITSRLAEPSEDDIVAGLSFLSALFQVDWQSASSIFQNEDILTAFTDLLDLYPTAAVSKEAAHLLSQASGHKACRAAIPPDCIKWLESSLRQTKDPALRASAAIAVVKLSRGATGDAAEVAGEQKDIPRGHDAELVRLMQGLIVNGDKDSLADAVEGLAYLSISPAVKETLCDDLPFLTKLCSVIPIRKAGAPPPDAPSLSLLYGVVIILSNLCAYRPRLSAEDAQMEKLRRMAKTSSMAQNAALDVLEDDEHAKQRGRKVVRCGGLEVLSMALRTGDSRGIRVASSKALLSLTEDKDNRGRILQSGGSKALMNFILKTLPAPGTSSSDPDLDAADLEAIQAVAKLAITASPMHVFGPGEGGIYDAIRPLAILLTHSSSTLLQRFESMMALTNISSHSPEAASRVAKAQGLMNKIEFLALEDHNLVRRAATELLCNLVAGSEDVFERYTGDGRSEGAKSKLHILIALSDIDDLPTRLAASGALATLTSSPRACRALFDLENERHRVLSTFTQLIDPTVLAEREEGDDEAASSESHPGLIHRGVVCARNFLVNLDDASRKTLTETDEMPDLLKALTNVVRQNGGNMELVRPTAEALKALIDCGMTISG